MPKDPGKAHRAEAVEVLVLVLVDEAKEAEEAGEVGAAILDSQDLLQHQLAVNRPGTALLNEAQNQRLDKRVNKA